MKRAQGRRGTGTDEDRAAPPDRRAEAFVVLEMNGFVLRQLSRVYAAFGGDLPMAMVLGEIAHHNLARREPGHAPDDLQAGGALLEPCNAYSISASTGIPYETVRRKVAALVERGWLVRDGRRNIFVTDKARVDLDDLTRVAAEDFTHVVRAVAPVLRMPSANRHETA